MKKDWVCSLQTNFTTVNINLGQFFQVDKDHNLMLHSNDRDELGCLKELHLNGPFGFEVVRYLLTGALDLRVLTLSIEWLDPTFCDSQPSGRKDLVGKRTI